MGPKRKYAQTKWTANEESAANGFRKPSHKKSGVESLLEILWKFGYRLARDFTTADGLLIECVKNGHRRSITKTSVRHMKAATATCCACENKVPRGGVFETNLVKCNMKMVNPKEYTNIYGAVEIECCATGHRQKRFPYNIIAWDRNKCGLCFGPEGRFYAKIKRLGGTVLGNWIGVYHSVLCRCSKGHETMVDPYVQEQMCRLCSKYNSETSKNDFYAYLASYGVIPTEKYVNASTPVPCVCPKGHSINILPKSAQSARARGGHVEICRECDTPNYSSDVSEQKFISKISKLGGIICSPYVACREMVECECPEGHECWVRPTNLVKGGILCQICSLRDPAVTETIFKTNIELMGGTVLEAYPGTNYHVHCKCAKGHDCYPRIDNIINGQGMCKRCCNSRGEKRLRDLFEELNYEIEGQFTLPGYVGKYDFGNEEMILEFDGIQHFQDVPHFTQRGGQNSFSFRRQRDVDKTANALAAGVKIIRIHHDWLKLDAAQQLKWLTDAIASPHKFIVSDLAAYEWLSHLNPHKI